jgi:hypothetical protein
MISIKNLAGDIVFIDVNNIVISNFFDLKKEYIKKYTEEYKQEIDIDKLMFLDENGNEFHTKFKISKFSEISDIYAFIIPPYVISECLHIDSPLPLPNNVISYFVFKYEMNKIGHPIVLSIGNTNIIFNQDSGKHCFKYDPIEKKIFYNSRYNSKNSTLIDLNGIKGIHTEENQEDKISVNIGDIGIRCKPNIILKEPSRSDVEQLDTDLIFYKCSRIKIDS